MAHSKQNRKTPVVRFTCLCITHGRHARLIKAIGCFLGQDHADRELVVLNCEAEPLGLTLAKVRVIDDVKDVPRAMQDVVKTSPSTHFVFWSPHCLYLPHHLSAFAQRFQSDNHWVWLKWHFATGRVDSRIEQIMRDQGNQLAFTRLSWDMCGGILNRQDTAFVGRLTTSLSGQVVDVENEALSCIALHSRVHQPVTSTDATPLPIMAQEAKSMARQFVKGRQRQAQGPICVVLLGRLGDIINILPCLKRLHDRYGKPTLMVSNEFASLLDGISYVEPWPVNLAVAALQKAVREAKRQHAFVISAQVWGLGIKVARHTATYNHESWRLFHMEQEFFNPSLRPEFDQRDREREQQLLHAVNPHNRPMLLVQTTACVSSPYANGPAMLEMIQKQFRDRFEVVDMGAIRAHRVYDLLGLMDNAVCLVSVDTATLHLAAATNVPVVALVHPAPWRGSIVRVNCVGRFTYEEADKDPTVICAAVERACQQPAASPPRTPRPRKRAPHAVLAYLPPPSEAHSDVFLRNMMDYPAQGELIYFSDHPWPDALQISNPTELVSNGTKLTPLVFLLALRLAQQCGFTQFVYMDVNCRVKRRHWDKCLVSALKPGVVAAGQLVVANPDKGSPRFSELHRLLPTGVAQQQTPGKRAVPFVANVPAAYNVAHLASLYPETPIAEAQRIHRLERDMGERLVQQHGDVQTLLMLAHVPDVLSPVDEMAVPYHTRIAALASGKVQVVQPIKTRWRPNKRTHGLSYYHSGDLGDIVYALKAIQLNGGGRLTLGTEYRGEKVPRSPVTAGVFNWFSPLLRLQPYLRDVQFSEYYVETDYDLNQFREFWCNADRFRKLELPSTLAKSHVWLCGLMEQWNELPWLTTKAKHVADFVIHRSFRYRENNFPWAKVMQRVGQKAVFIGLADEHEDFCKHYGSLPFYKVEDALDMANVIRGAQWFIGNQSFPCSLALGMGQWVFQETLRRSPDCVFDRPTFFNQFKLQPPFML